MFAQVIAALFESYKEYTASPFSAVWDWIGLRLGVKPVESPEGLAAKACFANLEIVDESRGGFAFVLFNVVCDWEPEHGMIIVCHKDQPASWTTADALELF